MMNYSTAKNGDIRLSEAGFSATVPVGHKRHAELLEMEAAGEITIAPYVAPDPLIEWRASASVPKGKFLIKAKTPQPTTGVAVLTKDEAKAAAKGDWPTAFADVLATMTTEEANDAEITFAAATVIERNSPLVAIAQAVKGLSDEHVDWLFQ